MKGINEVALVSSQEIFDEKKIEKEDGCGDWL
jgi:hypothetical protein